MFEIRITPLHNARLALQARLPPRVDVTHESRGSYLQLALVSDLHRLRAFHLARRHPFLVDEGAVPTAKVCTGRSNWILHRKLKNSICCLRDVILKQKEISETANKILLFPE